ncbi:Zinc finger, LIM-type domain-containing protein [Strongyloides ratti]|uniref:Zinc finger, LIM-type domain-containing protein n=1 Tax=Strongyloides ratti TaxID=34506 RepID=A0A090KQ55_STRRB|nr:Zinc finger, LIM-type domain-containing protein [Strongyloides ratti]CEF59514.1 Zinc finger, LIM-type domain-containing protein [Strongyloides ratti]
MTNYLDNNNLPPIMDKESLKGPYNSRSNIFYTVRTYNKSNDNKDFKKNYKVKDISTFVEEPKKDNIHYNEENLKKVTSTSKMFNKISNLSNIDFSVKSKHCKRCNNVVYEAEKVSTAGSVWHKTCFRCYTCLKSLQLGQISERNNEIYCNSCYAKDYGPKGYGHGVNVGTLSPTK